MHETPGASASARCPRKSASHLSPTPCPFVHSISPYLPTGPADERVAPSLPGPARAPLPSAHLCRRFAPQVSASVPRKLDIKPPSGTRGANNEKDAHTRSRASTGSRASSVIVCLSPCTGAGTDLGARPSDLTSLPSARAGHSNRLWETSIRCNVRSCVRSLLTANVETEDQRDASVVPKSRLTPPCLPPMIVQVLVGT